jgi:glycosyltransferase involved in cell wall biosynthesis
MREMKFVHVVPRIDQKRPLLDEEKDTSRTKPVVLTFARYYLPGYRAGGPIRTIANMVERLSDTFDFRIVALDRDLGDASPYPDIQADAWMARGKALVRYVSPKGFGLRRVVEIARSTPHDAIYLNSFFDPRFTQQVLVNNRLGRLCGRPIVIASRGEFSEGALRIKWWKKIVFISLAKRFKLYDGLTWQASSAREAEDIQRMLSVGERMAGRVVVSGNVTAAPDLTDSENSAGPSVAAGFRYRPEGPLRVCFLSRISPMKNLDFALRVLAQVRVPVRFAIYGPIEDATYWAGCAALIAKLPSNIEVVHEGTLEPAQVVPTLAQHHLFLFPTRGENFGHVIHEALRAGLPLLISDQTPWQRLAEQGVGWDLPLDDMRAFARCIEEVARWPQAVRDRYSTRASDLAVKVGQDELTLEANRRLFLDAIARRR